MTAFRFGSLCLAWVTGVAVFATLKDGVINAQEKQGADPLSLVLIQADLDDANKTLAIFDLDDDASLDEAECKKLKWAASVGDADLNHDQKLSQPEIALHFASVRDQLDIQQIDRTVAKRAIQKHDANRNGQIDPDEITSAWPPEPDQIDSNQDGILTVEELTHAFAFRRVVREEIGIIGVDQGWAVKISKRFDRDGDGKIGPSEWEQTPIPSNPEAGDEDGDGLLSVMEIATMLAKHRQKLGLTAKDLLTARNLVLPFDQDFDGVVSKAELARFVGLPESVTANLTAFDTNKDGDVSLLEIEKELGKRRDEKGYTDQDSAEANRLMMRHDVNHDKVIRADELKGKSGGGFLGKDVLPQADRDDNQAIDTDELARFLARERE